VTIANILAFLDPFGDALALIFGMVVALALVDWVVRSFLDSAGGRVR